MIRKAQSKDVEAIFKLIDLYATRGQMLHRTSKEITNQIDDFLVSEQDGKITGICSLKYGWNNLIEIRSLAVLPNYYRQGFGSEIVRECIDHALQNHNAEGIFVLTYAVPLFQKLGFEIIPKSTLPLKVWEDCMECFKRKNCDEVAMFRSLKSARNSYISSNTMPTALT